MVETAADRIRRLAERCHEYPSLAHPDLDDGLIEIPGEVGVFIPRGVLRRAVLHDGGLLANLLGYVMTDFHRAMFDWCVVHSKSAIEAGRGFGKSVISTETLTIMRILRDFDCSNLILSERDKQACKFLQPIRLHFERSWWLKQLFGVPTGGNNELGFIGRGKWTDHRIEIAQRMRVQMEGTVDAMGCGGGVTGGHWDHVIVDDPTSEETAKSEVMRDNAFEFYFTTLKPVVKKTLQVRATRYHYDDLIGRLEREIAIDPKRPTPDGGYFQHVYHWEDMQSEVRPVVPRDARMKILKFSAIKRDGTSLWEDQFPLNDRIEADGMVTEGLLTKRFEMGARRFAEQYQMQCEQKQEGARETECKESWLPVWSGEPHWEAGKYRFVLSVDPAWTSKEKAAKKHAKDRKPCRSALFFAAMDRHAQIGEQRFFLSDLHLDLMSNEELLNAIKKMADYWARRVGLRQILIRLERTGLQIREAPDFYKRVRDHVRPHRVVFVNPQENKLAYARPLFEAAERGEVCVSPNVEASGFVAACGDFPDVDETGMQDAIDAAAGAWHKLWRRGGNIRKLAERNRAGEAGITRVGAKLSRHRANAASVTVGAGTMRGLGPTRGRFGGGRA